MPQVQTFNGAIKQLFFNVDISKAPEALVDIFSSLEDLNHIDETLRRMNLNVAMDLGDDKPGWSVTHTFNFNKSPLPNLHIKSGSIHVTIGEAIDIKKLLDVRLVFIFNSKNEAYLFFEYLKKTFEPLSIINKVESDKSIGYIAQYSTRNPDEIGVKDASFILTNPIKSKLFEISISLLNRFIQ